MKLIASYETCQKIIRVYEADYKYNGHQLYIIESEHKVYKTVNTRFANKTQLESILNSYRLLIKRFTL